MTFFDINGKRDVLDIKRYEDETENSPSVILENKEFHRYETESMEKKHCRKIVWQCVLLGVVVILLAVLIMIQRSLTEKASVLNYIPLEAFEEEDKRKQVITREEELWAFGMPDAASEDILILVNKDHPLPQNYVVPLHWLSNRSCAVSEVMYDSLSRMLTDGSADGREYVVASGYRSRECQKRLLDEDIAAAMENQGLTYEQAYEQETRETMPPGYSEHETGLAVDIVALNYQILDEQQEMTAENQWLQENCSRYGFILRYPKGKEEITGVDYESWHFRYVGEEAAEEIMSRGITLEEYLEEQ